ncbi:hypothetical protein TNCV_2413761 [Trichonephila clavipes]|nr:hypothetical protein TNCV_2413761 [Trichonephila clavipes]
MPARRVNGYKADFGPKLQFSFLVRGTTPNGGVDVATEGDVSELKPSRYARGARLHPGAAWSSFVDKGDFP